MKLTALATLAVLGVLPAQAAHAALIGAAISETYYYPTDAAAYAGATYAPQNFVVAAGQESVINIENVTDIHVDFAASSLALLLNTTLSGPTWGSIGTYNGPIFSGSAISGITGVSVNGSSTLAGFDNSRVSIVGDDLRIDWGGLSYTNGTVLNLDFTFARDGTGAVPEPATWAMMIVGFGLVGVASRRRRTLPPNAKSLRVYASR
jgi:hypothetical protein